MKFFKHLAGGETRDGMPPVGCQFHHRAKEEIAFGQMGMWNLQRGCIDDHVTDGHDVYIHQAVNIMALTVTV